MKIIFFGTTNFATVSLERIFNTDHKIAAVVTVTDKPSGRNLRIKESDVKKVAKKKGIPVLQPNNLKDDFFLNTLKKMEADIFVIVAFKILPKTIWSMPQFGSINLHASLLPDYRGAAPINWAIMNGEKETGVTTFFLKQKVDTGDIIKQQKVAIPESYNASQLHNLLKEIGAKTLIETLDIVEKQTFTLSPQTNDLTSDKKAPKITPEIRQINLNNSCTKNHNQIRGLSDYPCAYTYLKNKRLKIFKSHFEKKKHNQPIGTITTDYKTYFGMTCCDGFIFFDNLQLETKKKMSVKEFLNGYQSLLK